MDKANLSSDQLIENYPPFRDWVAIVKLRKDIIEINDRRCIESLKISGEFIKIIIVNLQLINAGGLLAVPSLGGTLLGLTNLSRRDKLIYLGIPMASFAIGLFCASICAFFVYANLRRASIFWEEARLIIQSDIELTYHRFKSGKDAKSISGTILKLEKSVYEDWRVRKYAKLANIFGYLSLAFFTAACVFLASNSR